MVFQDQLLKMKKGYGRNMKNEKRVEWEKEQKEFEEYLKERENSAATIEKYMRDIRTFKSYMNEKNLISKQEILRYKEWLMENYSVNSVNSMLAALNQFLIYIEAGWLRVKRVRVQQQGFQLMKQELEKEDYRKLVNLAHKSGRHQIAMIMETICATGIRISELQFFRTDNVKSGMVEVRNKGKQRIVLIPEKLRKKLLIYMYTHKIAKGAIFCTRSGRAKDRSNIWKEMKNLASAAGVDEEKVFPHNLRHLFARTFYRTTKNLLHLADLLGHSSLSVTRIYAGDGIEEWRKSLEKMRLLEE